MECLKTELGEAFKDFLKKVEKKEDELTETDSFRALWEYKVTDSIKNQFTEGNNLSVVDCKNTSDGSNKRPTTKTTLQTWFKDFKPTPGHCYSKVELPIGIRMEKQLRTFLDKKNDELASYLQNFTVSWSCPTAAQRVQLGAYKDVIARAFYQEGKLKGLI